mmetsp:Transcript_54377/g.157940  ORF Transcript_54377/g.157940 Transcript_54377/m.157940 type:complete len:200 (+) Transcript_54377:164-763(+)
MSQGSEDPEAPDRGSTSPGWPSAAVSLEGTPSVAFRLASRNWASTCCSCIRSASLSAFRFSDSSSSSSLSCMCLSQTQAPKRLLAFIVCRNSATRRLSDSHSVSGGESKLRSFSLSSSNFASKPCFSVAQRSRSVCTRLMIDSMEADPFLAAASAARRSPKSKASTRHVVDEQLGVDAWLFASSWCSSSPKVSRSSTWC